MCPGESTKEGITEAMTPRVGKMSQAQRVARAVAQGLKGTHYLIKEPQLDWP